MFKKHVLILVVLFCLTSITVITTPAQPAQAYGVIGEPCSVSWIDYTIDPLGVIVDNTWLDSCPLNCFGDIAGDYHDQSNVWCVESVPPPNLPGINVIPDNYCSADPTRTVVLNTLGTLGTRFEIEGPTGIFDTTTYTFMSLAEGEHRFRARAHNAGGSSEWTEWAIVAQDYSAPITTPHFVGLMGDNNWYTTPVTVSFTANDAQCFGVSQTLYDVNGISASYTGAPFTVGSEGVNTLSFYSTDGHHPEAPQSTTIQIDSIPPDLAITPDRPVDASSGWWNAPVSFIIQASDATSGILSIEQDVNGSGLTPYTGVISFVTDGVHSLDAQAIDNAGHENYTGVVIQIDSVAPTLVPDVTGTTNGTTWFISPPTMTLSATDATSGVLGLGYIVNGGGMTLYTAPVSFTQDGVYDVQAIALDVAQNTTTESFQIAYDSTAPQLSINLVGDKGENGWFISPPSFVVTASDTTSQVGSIGYTVDNGGWNTYTTPVTITREGLYGLFVEVRDVATNSTAHSFQIGYDITPPQTNAVLTETEDGMVITLNRWDGVSGFALTRMAINGVWQDYHHPMTVTEKGMYWVQFFTTDFAGNIEAEKMTTFTIEEAGVMVIQNPPVVSILPPSNPPNIPPFETDDDFPPNLGDETLYYVSPPPVVKTPPNVVINPRITTTGNDGKHNGNTETTLHGDPNINRPPVIRESVEIVISEAVFPPITNPPVGHPPRISTLPFIRERDNSDDTPISQEANNGGNTIRFIPEIMDDGELFLEDNPESAVIYDPLTSDTTSSSSPANGLLAILGVVAGAGALTLTATAIAKKKEQEAQQAQALADLQAQQATQAQNATTNWDANQLKQTEATQTVMLAGKQSQANKNYWAAYAIWKAKVAEAQARRRAQELARRQAEAETQLRQLVNQYGNLLRLLLVLGVVVFTLLSLIPQPIKPRDDIYAKPLIPEQSQTACISMRFIPPWLKFMLCMLSGSVVLSPADELAMSVYFNTIILDMNELAARDLVIAQARTQIATAVDEARQEDAKMPTKHMALGFGDERLINLTINLNLLLNSNGVTVHAYYVVPTNNQEARNHLQQYMITIFRANPSDPPTFLPSDVVPDWNGAGITNDTLFSSRFLDVARKVSVIHFNLDGIGGGTQALEWARENGIKIEKGMTSVPLPITSNELLTIAMMPDLCAKTIFYSSGGSIPLAPPPIPDFESKAIICAGS
ncbi:MAG: hypothetical protein SFZ02_07245 [bacterium]|nr:hypothetical protein [bacterium]